MAFFKNLSRFADLASFISNDGVRLSYADLIQESSKIFEHIARRCLVFCLCSNTPGSLIGYVSFISNGVVPLMLDANLDRALLNDLILKYSPSYFWLPADMSDAFEGNEIVYQNHHYILVKNSTSADFPLAADLGLLLTTSGSTGSPKLVRLSYQNIEANAESIATYLAIDERERPITSLPMHYSFGISIINSHLIKGATILLNSRSIIEKEFWAFFREQQASSLSGVPYTFEILKKLRFFRMDLPSLKTITQAGGKLNIDLNREYVAYSKETNRKFIVMYGQTEATARMSYLPAESAESKLGSIGIAIPGGIFELIDDSRKLITDNDVPGELVYYGKNVSLGYAESGADLFKGDENHSRLFTGDIAKRDQEGFYYIVGRKKRFIKIFGNRINLDEAEQLLKKIIEECACTGGDDKMEIYITDKGRIEEIKTYISKKLALHPTGFEVRGIEFIPKSAAGKIEYSKLNSSWS